MKVAVLLSVLIVCMVSSTEAWWGRGFGGFGGFGFRPWGLGYGYGYPYGLGYGYGYPYGYGAYVGRSADLESRVECVVTPTKNMINCNQGKVECEVTERLDHVETTFDMFGIEFVDNKYFRLYPKLFTDSFFGDYKFKMANGTIVELSLFAAGSDGYGLMVKDPVCYGKIVDQFRLVKSPVKADVALNRTLSSKVVISGFIIEV